MAHSRPAPQHERDLPVREPRQRHEGVALGGGCAANGDMRADRPFGRGLTIPLLRGQLDDIEAVARSWAHAVSAVQAS